MALPNFIIIGAAKSGTTALYHYLKQHPQIYMSPVKETEFFAFEGEELNFRGPGDLPRATITDWQDYQDQFEEVGEELAIGEASPVYIYSPKAPERIKHYLPQVKIIAILRDPIARAYSQYLMFRRDQRESIADFSKAIELEKERQEKGWAWGWRYLELGFYYQQLERYFAEFPKEQIKVYLYEDLQADPLKVLADIFAFLAVDTGFTPDTSHRPNISGVPKNDFWQTFLRKPNFVKDIFKPFLPTKLREQITEDLKKRNLTKPELPGEIRKQLLSIYREDVLKLQNLIHRDLSSWLD